MIDTLGTIAERVIRRLSGGDIPSDSPYKMEFVVEDVRDALAEDLKLEMLQRRGQGGVEDDRTPVTQAIATYLNVVVKEDPITKQVYADLPSNYMSLKHNKGIHWVADMRTPLVQMIPVANAGVTVNLPHADMERQSYGFYVEGLKLLWIRNILRDKVTKVMVKLIVASADTLGIDEPLPVLPENVARIIDRVIGMQMNPRLPQDRLNDNNPNIRAQNA